MSQIACRSFRSSFIACMALVLATWGALAHAQGPQSSADAAGPPINMTIKDAPVAEVMAMLSEASGVNIVVGQDVTGTIESVNLRNVTVEQALRYIAMSAGLYWRKEDNGYIVAAKPLPGGTSSPDLEAEAVRQSATLPPTPAVPHTVVRPVGSSSLVSPLVPLSPFTGTGATVGAAPDGSADRALGSTPLLRGTRPAVPTGVTAAVDKPLRAPAIPGAARESSAALVSPLTAAVGGKPAPAPAVSAVQMGVSSPNAPAATGNRSTGGAAVPLTTPSAVTSAYQPMQPALPAALRTPAVTSAARSVSPAPPAAVGALPAAPGYVGAPTGGAVPGGPVLGERPIIPSAPAVPLGTPIGGNLAIPPATTPTGSPVGPPVAGPPTPAPPIGASGAPRGTRGLLPAPPVPGAVAPAGGTGGSGGPSANTGTGGVDLALSGVSPTGSQHYQSTAAAPEALPPELPATGSTSRREPQAPEVRMLKLDYADPAAIALMLGGTVQESTTLAPVRHLRSQRAARRGRRSTTDVYESMGISGGADRYWSQQLDLGSGLSGRSTGTGGRGGRGSTGGFQSGGRTGGLSGGGLGGAGQGMRPEGIDSIIAFMPQNALLVSGEPAAIDQLREVLALLDQPTKQVEISTKFLAVTVTKEKASGIDWFVSNGSLEFFNLGYAPGEAVNNVVRWARGKFEATLALSQSNVHGTVITEPHITTQNNMPAYISFYTTIPYFTAETTYNQFGNRETTFSEEEVDVEQTLEVTPRINADDTITMFLAPIMEDQGPDVVGPNGERIPIVFSQELETQVTVADGETVVLGGIIRKRQIMSNRATPLLSEIPIIGDLFKRRVKNVDDEETLIFVTPRIVRDIPAP